MGDDIFSEQLSPEFVRKVISGRYDMNCDYYLVTTTSGFEIMARNNVTKEDTIVMSAEEFEHATVTADETEPLNDPLLDIEASSSFWAINRLPILVTLFFTVVIGIAIFLSIGNYNLTASLEAWLKSLAQSLKG